MRHPSQPPNAYLRIRRGTALIVGLALAAGCASSPPKTTATTVPTVATTTTTTTPTTTGSTTSTTAPPPPTTRPTAPPTTAPAAVPATVVTKGATDRREVALTFDAGSDVGYTAQILGELAANHILATFGITGVWAQANPGLVRQIAAAGHQIVNHTWDHRSFTGASTNSGPLSAADMSQELARTDGLILELTGHGTAGWFRPPYGDRNPAVDAYAGAAGYRWELMWTVDTLGWKGVPPSTVVQRALSALAPGEIVLMHVGAASTDAAALPALIHALQAQGYGFATAAALVHS